MQRKRVFMEPRNESDSTLMEMMEREKGHALDFIRNNSFCMLHSLLALRRGFEIR